MKKSTLIIFMIAIASLVTLVSSQKELGATSKIEQYYLANLDSLKQTVALMENGGLTIASLQDQFYKARKYYKRAEFLITYYFPHSAQKINGANVLESSNSEPNEVIFATGFQVLEEALFDPEVNKHTIQSEISGLAFAINNLISLKSDLDLTPSSIMDALKLNIYRLISQGIAGFDSPVILNSIPEAKETLTGTKEVIYLMGSHNTSLLAEIERAINYLNTHSNSFNEFNRAIFISQYLNPVCHQMHDYYSQSGIPFDTLYPKLIPAHAPDLFSYSNYDLKYFAPSDALPMSKTAIELGKKLFFDKRLSGSLTRSCATCHNPDKAFTDGKDKNISLNGNDLLLRNTPTLINAALQPAQFYDRRTAFLEDQIHDVISNEHEMNGHLNSIAAKIIKDKSYKPLFKQVFKNEKIDERNIKRALATYVRSLVALSSPFDLYMQGDTSKMSPLAVEGFNLFMGKGKCGTCHFVPLFNGTLPPVFNKIETEVIGVPAIYDTVNAVLDKDLGAFHIYGAEFHKHSFKTTTVRNAAATAPYMHNGAIANLNDLMDFYNRGGGLGLGLTLPYQTLPGDALDLSTHEQKAIIEFIFALTDTVRFR